MLVSCSRCGRVHERGACPVKRRAEAARTEQRRFRSSQAWTDASLRVRERDRWLCAACAHAEPPRYVSARLSVHHIDPVAERWEARLDPANLVTLCPACHEAAERGDIPRGRLRSWASEAERRDG